MKITYDKKRSALIAEIDGDIDHHSAAGLRKRIDDAFIRYGAVNIIFDFTKLEFMDSSAIGLIMGRAKLVGALGGKVILSGVSAQMDRLLGISGIYKITLWAETEEAALRLLGQEAAI